MLTHGDGRYTVEQVADELFEHIRCSSGASLETLKRWSTALRSHHPMAGPIDFGITEQTSLPLPPPERARARTTDPRTSRDAARSVNVSKGRMLVLKALEGGAKTDEVIRDQIAMYGEPISPSGARTRRKECVDAGWVEASGVVQRGKSRRHYTVWKITASGINALRRSSK